MTGAAISTDPRIYGSKGQTWAPEFVKYMGEIVTHPNYEGMPDAVGDKGKIQWEAPSNRSGGRYQFTNQKRRDWWREKAKSIGIDVSQGKWLSRTAKIVHPTGLKPCKRCGRQLRIAYAYPNTILVKRVQKEFKNFEVSKLEEIGTIISRAFDADKGKLFSSIKHLLKAKNLDVPDFDKLEKLREWIEDVYIPSEPPTLGPGAMSNAPDRFDGFHSFNRCCRGKADTGRSSQNLQSYNTDRRVFEYWSEGDWIAADRLMGLVRTELSDEDCADGGSGPPTADHIGPLSLGFCHRPEFRLLSGEANSAKNNRMTLEDFNDLVACENAGTQILTWYAQPIWDRLKGDVDTEEKALRLSKAMRDNQRNAIAILARLYSEKRLSFLTYLLELEYADWDVKFVHLRANKYLTVYDELVKSPRTTAYAAQQQARRIRIGFEALRSFLIKDNRHLTFFAQREVESCTNIAIGMLENYNDALLTDEYREIVVTIEDRLIALLIEGDGTQNDSGLRELAASFPKITLPFFEGVKAVLEGAMSAVAEEIAEHWESDRYVREEYDYQ